MLLSVWVRLGLLCAVAAGVTGCSQAGPEPRTEAGNVIQGDSDHVVSPITDGTLTVCTEASYKPFEFKEGAEFKGFDIDVITEVAKDLSVAPTFIDMPFEGLKSGAALQSKKCDVAISAITINDQRRQVMDFSNPYFTASQALLARADSGITSVQDLAGKKVGAQSGTTGLNYVQDNLADATLVEFEALPQLTTAVTTGKIDAGIGDNGALRHVAFENPDLTVVEEFGTNEQYGIAVAQGNTVLVDKVNATLDRISTDGTLDTITGQWFSSK